MTEITIIPAEAQVQSMLESAMTDAEDAHLESIERRSFSASDRIIRDKFEMAKSLYEVYQNRLFRGKSGGRTWKNYLNSIDLHKLGYKDALSTEAAGNEMMFALLCEAIDSWNKENPARPPLPMPNGSSYLDGWTTLFDRSRVSGSIHNYAPFGGCSKALQTWKTAVFQAGGVAPTRDKSRSAGRKARDAGYGRPRLSGVSDNSSFLKIKSKSDRVGLDDNLGSQPRTVSTQSRMEAAAAQREREERQAQQKAEEKSLREDGIDPRLISKMDDGPEIDAMAECETYCTQLNQLQQDVQRIESWVTGRLNLYGSEGMDALRQVDAGIYTINDDVKAISSLGLKLLDLSELLSDVVLPGDLSSSSFEVEPTA